MRSGTLTEGKSWWVADALAARSGSKFGILASASREISYLTYLKNIIATPSAGASDLVWPSSGDWGKSWTTGLMCALRRGRAPPFPSRFRGGEHTSVYLNQYQRLNSMVSSSAAPSLSSKTRRPYGRHSIG